MLTEAMSAADLGPTEALAAGGGGDVVASGRGAILLRKEIRAVDLVRIIVR